MGRELQLPTEVVERGGGIWEMVGGGGIWEMVEGGGDGKGRRGW